MEKYVGISSLSSFLSKLKLIFSDINHTHEDMLNDINNLEQTVSKLPTSMQYNIVPITQNEYDNLTYIDENTLYIIEV